MVTSLIFYWACSGTKYELTARHPSTSCVPRVVWEGADGMILDRDTGRTWQSLPSMTHDLGVELVGWASEVGD